jgi:O-antigen/teichoic acid export membrane protein
MSRSLQTASPSGQDADHLVIRNTFYLTAAQVLTVPLSIVLNAVAAHYLGAEAFGYTYLAATLCTFGFLAVAWGQDASLPAAVAQRPYDAGTILGTSLVWRAITSVLVYTGLAMLCRALGYNAEMQWALALTAVLFASTNFIWAYKDAIRGLERTDVPAYAHVGQQVLATLLVCLTFVAGGGLRAMLVAQSVACAIVIAILARVVRKIGIHPLSVHWTAMKELITFGAPFMLASVAMTLQPNIDAVFLSKLAPPEVMGWYAVSRRLVGALLLPATALIGALYPTLCRLQASDRAAFNRAANGALRSVALPIAPVALGCAFFPQLGVALFSRKMFGPAEDNLRIYALFIPLVYLSMPLGTAIMAAGRQVAWSLVQCLAVAISIVLNPILVPMFQRTRGNGGLGLCIASVASEIVMVGCALVLLPKGVLDRRLGRVLLGVIVSGIGFAGAALALPQVPDLLRASIACAVYVVGLWLTGTVNTEQIGALFGALRRDSGTDRPSLAPNKQEGLSELL